MIESLDLGGAEKSLVTLLQNLDYTSYKVTLLLIKKEGVFNKFVPEEVKIIYHDIFAKTTALKKIITRLNYWVLRKLNTKYNTAHLFWKTFGNLIPTHNKNYDIAIAYSQGFATYFVADKVTAKRKYSWLNTNYQKAGHNATFDYNFYKKFNRIIAVSKEAKKNFLNAFKNLNLKTEVSVVKDILDDTIIKKKTTEKNDVLPKNKKTTNIVTVGRLANAKGYPLAIEACKLLLDKGYNINWHAIGEGPKRKEIEKLIKKRGVQNNFHLLGFQENPYPYMNKCDIYVQTSLFEGLGLTVIEAAILQKPIVTTDFPTASTIITHNKTGLICKMTAEAIAIAIQEYIDSPKLVKKVSQNLQKLDYKDKEVSLQRINELLAGK